MKSSSHWAADGSSESQIVNPYVQEDLELLQKTVQYRAWIFSLITPYLGQRILEIGSGVGNYTEKLVGRERVWATEVNPHSVSLLMDRFAQNPAVTSHLLDVANISEKQLRYFRSQKVDTIVVLNVLEHIHRDLDALMNLKECLIGSGRVVLVVPALPFLYGSLDEAYGHHRRYTLEYFHAMVGPLRMSLEVCNYFNFLGILGWYLNARLLRKRNLPEIQTHLFDKIVPILRRMERHYTPPIGLSLLAVFVK